MDFPELKIGELVCSRPIIQGGMGVGISLSGLASAVANAGGIGVIAGAMIGIGEPDVTSDPAQANVRVIKREIRRARRLSDGVIGVNIMVALTHAPHMIQASVEEGVDVVFCGAGLPLDLPRFLTPGAKTKLVPIISSARAARLICQKWHRRYNYLPDAFVVEGPKAGGHLGFKVEQLFDPAYSLENLIREVVDTVDAIGVDHNTKIPVIAAGGVYTGADIRAMLELGASGVQMGTRFVATHECDAAAGFKQVFVDARKEDLMVIKSPVGMPGRAVRNRFLVDVEKGAKKPFSCPYHCVRTCKKETSPYCIGLALNGAKQGRFKYGFAFAGSNAHRVNEIVSVADLMDDLERGYRLSGDSELATPLMVPPLFAEAGTSPLPPTGAP